MMQMKARPIRVETRLGNSKRQETLWVSKEGTDYLRLVFKGSEIYVPCDEMLKTMENTSKVESR